MTNSKKKKLLVFTDGGSRGNPGLAGCGFLIKNPQGKTIIKSGAYIGRSTNNIAEYTAVLNALKYITENINLFDYSNLDIDFYLDSLLVVNQLIGKYKVKNTILQKLHTNIKSLEKKISSKLNYHHVKREKNKEADALVNQALDSKSTFLHKLH